MSSTHYRGRRAATIENERLRVSVLIEGGHIAEVTDMRTGVNPLWTPHWPSIEPSAFNVPAHGDLYGAGADGALLAGIMGHNLCLDIFGGPSEEEAATGLTAHGEASILPYDITVDGATTLTATALLPLARLSISRRIELTERTVHITERVTNLTAFDRPIAWTQHVTLAPPFLEKGVTEFRLPATRSMVFPGQFGPADYLPAGACFEWPYAPRLDGAREDLRRFTSAPVSTAYTAHVMDEDRDEAFFVAFSPRLQLAFGYVWKRSDFPWLGIWEENHARAWSPWNSEALTRGMEFGVSPFPETRRSMIDRGRVLDTPTYRWLPARSEITVRYRAALVAATEIPDWSNTL